MAAYFGRGEFTNWGWAGTVRGLAEGEFAEGLGILAGVFLQGSMTPIWGTRGSCYSIGLTFPMEDERDGGMWRKGGNPQPQVNIGKVEEEPWGTIIFL